MAFLNFLKKTNKDTGLNFDLDVPPPPPLPLGESSSFGEPQTPMPPNQPLQSVNNSNSGFVERKPFSASLQFPPQNQNFNSPPPFPQAPPFDSFQMKQQDEKKQIPASSPQTPPVPDFGMPKFDSSLKSPDDLGLDFGNDEDIGKFPGFDSNEDSLSSQTQKPQETFQPPQIPTPQTVKTQETAPVEQKEEQLETAPQPKKIQDAPPKFDYDSLINDMQTKSNSNSNNQQLSNEPEDDELESPPIPALKFKSDYDVFGKELREAQMQQKRKVVSGPLFVTMTDFKEVLERNDFVRAKLKEASDTLERVSAIENTKNDLYEKWRKDIAELQKKFLLVDRKIFELEM